MKKTFSISGMSCSHCSMRVKKALEEIDGLESAVVDHEKGLAVIEMNRKLPLELLQSSVDEAGYSLAAEID